jgi:hypothetical protein
MVVPRVGKGPAFEIKEGKFGEVPDLWGYFSVEQCV